MRPLSILVFLVTVSWLHGGELGPEARRRAVERQARVGVLRGYAEARIRAQSQYLNDLAGACQWLVTQQAQAEAKKVIGEIEKTDPKFSRLPELQKAVGAIPAAKPLEEARKLELAARIKAARQARAQGFIGLASTCYQAGLIGLAYDLVWDILEAEPDNQIARAAIRHVKAGDAWYDEYALSQLQKGNRYVAGLGWVPMPAVDRVQKGEWFENNRFLPMAEAEKTHAGLASPWMVETQNFILKSTASRKTAVEMAERLEGIRALCFRQYLEFFMRGSGKRGTQLLFNQSAPQKMVVYYFGNKRDYDATVRKDILSQNQELLLASAGFYNIVKHASYFYHDPESGAFLVTVMQHEVTHQILGEYSRGYAPQVWLLEGVAECLEAARPGKDGRLSLPVGLEHSSVRAAARMLNKSALPSLSVLFGMPHELFHEAAQQHLNYTVSGAVCRCLLEMDDGSFAADFLDYLYDSYHGTKTSLPDYVGMDTAALEKRFHQYLREGR
jgi:hypothetical protein